MDDTPEPQAQRDRSRRSTDSTPDTDTTHRPPSVHVASESEDANGKLRHNRIRITTERTRITEDRRSDSPPAPGRLDELSAPLTPM
ncbi:Hypothetical predicted protein [Marmota monax]|uniref:Uncharacterized protein n=1 Tax=Marmota monax TaxID=9995 RepID=A0A5E4C7N6_MARMO|nr:Hypothetical predicted protein [Marmota monax]